MGFLNGLFALLSVVFLVLLIVGLINPSWVKMKSRGKSTLIYFIAMLACSVVVGVTTSDEEKARQKAESEKRQQIEAAEAEKKKIDSEQNKQESINPPQPEVIPEISKETLKPVANEQSNASLGFTPEEFRQKLNDEIIQVDADGLKPLKKIEVVKGTFNIGDLSGLDLSLLGKVNNQGKIESLNYIFPPSKTEEEVAGVLLYLGLTAKILNPEISMEKKSPKIVDLITKAAKGIDNKENMHREKVGNVTYFTNASKNTGFWFGFDAE
ncbi:MULTISPECIES: hypothetical protein [Acinetobacter]|uniref:Uncharacterized protein n=1 Tax=Acinetobacter guerrae TaxID=1843371 RepID=A0A3A8EFN1_9GAMM|nr:MULTISPECIES: hypothetical protein [Acinetobacter]RKG33385.1 hypothetical protein D7V21_09430 [Acinetobacter guerrae]BBF79279.1 hypothetical protein URS_3317 [Acinetobacter ursingii]